MDCASRLPTPSHPALPHADSRLIPLFSPPLSPSAMRSQPMVAVIFFGLPSALKLEHLLERFDGALEVIHVIHRA